MAEANPTRLAEVVQKPNRPGERPASLAAAAIPTKSQVSGFTQVHQVCNGIRAIVSRRFIAQAHSLQPAYATSNTETAIFTGSSLAAI